MNWFVICDNCLCQDNLSFLQLQLLIELGAVFAIEMQDFVCLTFITELLHLFGCHLMAVNGSPDGELTLDILVAVVGTVIGACAYSYLTATLWTLTDGGVQHHLSFCCRGE